MFFLDYIWLVPLFPAFGAAIMFFFGRKLRKGTVSAVCVGAVALAFVLSAARSGSTRDTPTTTRASLSRKSSTPGWVPTPAT